MESFVEFFGSTRDVVFRAVLAATGDRAGAEDAVAEAYARAYARWESVSAHPNSTAWVLRTALNAHRSVWRRRRREVLAEMPPESLARVLQPFSEPSSLDSDVREAVRALPRRQREVIGLRVLADLSAEETGVVLGIATATVHVHLSRALAAVRRRLEQSPSDRLPPGSGARGGSGVWSGPDGAPLDVLEFSFSTRGAVRHAFGF